MFGYIHDVRFTDKISCQGKPADDTHRKINFELCRALDMTKMGIVLDAMVEAGVNKQLAEIYRANASTLLALLRTENNRIHGF